MFGIGPVRMCQGHACCIAIFGQVYIGEIGASCSNMVILVLTLKVTDAIHTMAEIKWSQMLHLLLIYKYDLKGFAKFK